MYSASGGIINPLQIKKVPLDDEEADEVEYKSKGMGAMALHFQTLRTFFKLLYPELDSIHIARLEEVLEELYKRVRPALKSKVDELQKYGNLSISK